MKLRDIAVARPHAVRESGDTTPSWAGTPARPATPARDTATGVQPARPAQPPKPPQKPVPPRPLRKQPEPPQPPGGTVKTKTGPDVKQVKPVKRTSD